MAEIEIDTEWFPLERIVGVVERLIANGTVVEADRGDAGMRIFDTRTVPEFNAAELPRTVSISAGGLSEGRLALDVVKKISDYCESCLWTVEFTPAKSGDEMKPFTVLLGKAMQRGRLTIDLGLSDEVDRWAISAPPERSWLDHFRKKSPADPPDVELERRRGWVEMILARIGVAEALEFDQNFSSVRVVEGNAAGVYLYDIDLGFRPGIQFSSQDTGQVASTGKAGTIGSLAMTGNEIDIVHRLGDELLEVFEGDGGSKYGVNFLIAGEQYCQVLRELKTIESCEFGVTLEGQLLSDWRDIGKNSADWASGCPIGEVVLGDGRRYDIAIAVGSGKAQLTFESSVENSQEDYGCVVLAEFLKGIDPALFDDAVGLEPPC